jgi:hypothetical protein
MKVTERTEWRVEGVSPEWREDKRYLGCVRSKKRSEAAL